MDWLWKLFGAGMSIFQGVQLDKKQKQYNSAIEQQIKEGKSLYEARRDAAMRMIATDPDFAQSKKLLEQNMTKLPEELRQQYRGLVNTSEADRLGFLNQYDTRTGRYLAENDRSTADLLADWDARSGGISGNYAKREADVLGILEGQGEQALKDTKRTFGEQRAEAVGRLAERGLSGGGVGASVGGGFATRESDQMARIREAIAAQRADAMAKLRGDTLGWGERAATLGAGFQESGIARQLAAREKVDAGRASFDAAMRGDSQAMRERAIQGVYGAQGTGATNLASYLTGQGQNRVGTYLNTTGDLAQYVGGGPVQNVPPDPGAFNNSLQSFGYGVGYGS